MSNIFYMPILKWKQAEVGALRDLNPEERKKMAPLIQLVPKYTRVSVKPLLFEPISKKEVLNNALANIQKYLSDFKIYLDSSLLYDSERIEVFEATNNSSTLFGTNIIPVLDLSDVKTGSYSEGAMSLINKQGICLRVYKEEVNDEFWRTINLLLSRLRIDREKVDLLLDYRVTSSIQSNSFLSSLKKTKNTQDWRLFYFASGAFPENLTQCTIGTNELLREDWKLWKDITDNINGFRRPIYSDYTIQYPIYSAPVNNPNTSYSVRYATPEKWVVMRGQARNAKNSMGIKQYYAHAVMLKNLGICNEACCKGDTYILKVAQNPNGEGNNPKWLRVGINHHISTTLKQLADEPFQQVTSSQSP